MIWPPHNVLKQRVRAIEQLTMARSVAIGSLTFGRTMTTNAGGGASPDFPSSVNLGTNQGAPPELGPSQGREVGAAPAGNGYVCNTSDPTYYYGIWQSDGLPPAGMSEEDLDLYWTTIHGNPNFYLLNSIVQGSMPAAVTCPGSGGSYNTNSRATIWQREVPTDEGLGCFLIEKTTPANFEVGSYLATVGGGSPASPYPVQPNDTWEIITKINYAGAGVTPALLKHLPPGCTILGARVKITLNNLTILHSHVDFTGETVAGYNPSQWLWTKDGINYYSGGAYQETLTSLEVAFAVAALRASDGYPEILQVQTLDLNTVESGVSVWVDLTGCVRAMWARWNEGFTNGDFAIMACDPNAALTIADEAALDGRLLAMRPIPARSVGLRSDGSVETMAYSLDTYKATYASMTLDSDIFLTIQWPNGSVSEWLPMLAYNAIPPLA